MANVKLLTECVESSDWSAAVAEGIALRFDPSRRVMLRFKLQASAPEELEALRYARRVMIREERARGLDWEEPSIEDPMFAGSEVRWFALASQAAWCRLKVAELVERANRAVGEMRSAKF